MEPYSPLLQIMQQINAYSTATATRETGLRSLSQASALTGIIHQAAEALRALDPIRIPAPAFTRFSTQVHDTDTDPSNSIQQQQTG